MKIDKDIFSIVAEEEIRGLNPNCRLPLIERAKLLQKLRNTYRHKEQLTK